MEKQDSAAATSYTLPAFLLMVLWQRHFNMYTYTHMVLWEHLWQLLYTSCVFLVLWQHIVLTCIHARIWCYDSTNDSSFLHHVCLWCCDSTTLPCIHTRIRCCDSTDSSYFIHHACLWCCDSTTLPCIHTRIWRCDSTDSSFFIDHVCFFCCDSSAVTAPATVTSCVLLVLWQRLFTMSHCHGVYIHTHTYIYCAVTALPQLL